MKRMIALSVIMHLYACGKGGNTSQLNITASAAADLCRSDVLTRRAAVGRVEWAFRCGLIKGDADASAEALKKSYLFKSDGTPLDGRQMIIEFTRCMVGVS